jgi:hypothetical protein
MKKYIKLFILSFGLLAGSSCSLDLLDSPNAVTTSSTDLNFLLNNTQLAYRNAFNGFSDIGLRLTRMLNQGAVIYDNAVTPGGVDGIWGTTYSGALNDIKTLISLAEKQEFFLHTGIARILRSHLLTMLVDHFGDVPYTKALDPNEFNPTLDKGSDLYDLALADLNKAIEDLGKTHKGTANDFFFKGDKTKWIRLANTMKLRILLNRRLVDNGAATAINALIAGNNLIQNNSQSFFFKYGTNLNNPDSRHPRYAGQYSGTGGGDYQSNYYMRQFIDSKGFADPRLRYYFYRQVITDTQNANELRCITNQKPRHYADDMVFCVAGSLTGGNNGYWGRDHLNNEGIPPDGLKRTAWGVYPAGGAYDNDANKAVSLGGGAGGAGVQPILMASFADFMLAESALILKTTGDPKALLESAIRKSMSEVRDLSLATSQGAVANAFESSKGYVYATEVDRYVNKVKADYDAATTDDARLNIILTEYWLASWGNGIEPYNFYRRTGKPAGLQPALDPNPGEFVYSVYYPIAYVTRNSNAVQKTNVTTKVFWDKNPNKVN